jgi:branched-chain amino acid transport system substrate-binding protein
MKRIAIGSLTAVIASAFIGLAQASDLVVAQVASKTHPNSAELAKGLELGYQIYFSRINDQGGVRGKKITLRNVDDGFNAQKMIETTKALADDKNVIALAGFVGSGGLAQMAKENLLGQLKLPMIAPLQGDKSVVSAPNFFPFRAGYDDEINAMVAHAIRNYQRQRIAVIHLGASFGPILATRTEEETKKLGAQFVGKEAYELAPDKIEASAKQAVAKIAATKPDAVILVTAGKVGGTLIAELREKLGTSATLYAISALQALDVVKQIGAPAAQGVIFAQSVPYPYSSTSRLVIDYQRDLKKYAPNQVPGFSSLEGYAGARIVVAALQRAGANPTREKLIATLNNLGELDIGGYSVRYSNTSRRGWGSVDLTILSKSGQLVK